MTSEYEIRVERQLMNPPNPVGLAVLHKGKPVAFLTIEQVRAAVDEYEALQIARDALKATGDT